MLEKIRETFKKKTTTPSTPKEIRKISLIDAIKRDHDDLKEMLEIFQDDEVSFSEKKKILPDFSSLLKSHSFSEQKAVYDVCVEIEEIRHDTYTGSEEHDLCSDLLKKIPESKTREQWVARVKVLADLVENHILNEEKNFLPNLEDHLHELDEKKMVQLFLELRQKSQKLVYEDNAGVLQHLHA